MVVAGGANTFYHPISSWHWLSKDIRTTNASVGVTSRCTYTPVTTSEETGLLTFESFA